MILLLPERRHYSRQALSPKFARLLGRGDRLVDAAAGEQAQLQRHFRVERGDWPIAAITRDLIPKGGAAHGAWLRADPAFVRTEASGARLQAWGAELDVASADAEAIAGTLNELLNQQAMDLRPAADGRWYIATHAALRQTGFPHPADALGVDLLSMLPSGEAGREWRVLFNELQVLLHAHPVNAARIARGRLPINALWLWGAGSLPVTVIGQPAAVRSSAKSVLSEDVELLALARAAALPEAKEDASGALVDLRRVRDWAKVERVVADALAEAELVELDFGDGARWQLRAGQRWRFWRRALALLDDPVS